MRDGAFGVEFGCHVGTADEVDLSATGLQVVVQISQRLLTRADDDVVDLQGLRDTVDRDMQPLVVDALSS